MKTILELGSTLDTLDRGELREELAVQTQEGYRQLARGVKYLRLQPTTAAIAANAFSLDGSRTGLGPREGFIWSIMRLSVAGLATGATPDVANVYRNAPAGNAVWQFNGNNFITTFSKLQLLLLPGETLSLASVGVVNATGSVTLSGDYVEVASEEIFKLF